MGLQEEGTGLKPRDGWGWRPTPEKAIVYYMEAGDYSWLQSSRYCHTNSTSQPLYAATVTIRRGTPKHGWASLERLVSLEKIMQRLC